MTVTAWRKTGMIRGALILIFLVHAIWGQNAARDGDVPPDLTPPEGAKLILRVVGKGDQIYSCQQLNARYSWTLKAPEAQLFDKGGQVVGRHFAGPTWELDDKSAVTGKVIARAESTEKDAIPWLLLAAVDHSGKGVLTAVSNIQRLNTKGGKAPSTGCDEPHVGQETRVPYTADYLFYESKLAH